MWLWGETALMVCKDKFLCTDKLLSSLVYYWHVLLVSKDKGQRLNTFASGPRGAFPVVLAEGCHFDHSYSTLTHNYATSDCVDVSEGIRNLTSVIPPAAQCGHGRMPWQRCHRPCQAASQGCRRLAASRALTAHSVRCPSCIQHRVGSYQNRSQVVK